MYYLIGADGKTNGPLSAADIHQRLAEGRANKYSRVRAEHDETWQPLSAIPELSPVRREPDAPPDTPGPPPSAERVSLQDVVAGYVNGAPSLDAARCVARGWVLVRDNPVILIGSALVAWSLIVGVSFLPSVGWIAGTLVNSPLLGGLYLVYLGRIRSQPVKPEDVFAGFRRAYVPLVLAGLFVGAVTTPGLIAVMDQFNPVETRTVPRAFALLLIPGIYLAVCYMFVLPLVMDKRLDVWAALEVSRQVVRRQWWTALALGLIAALIALAGVLALGVGLVIAVPVATATIMYAYDDLFGG